MSFIRTKKVDGKDYAYLVENKWYKRRFKGKGRGPRQKVSKYLGRVYSFNKKGTIDFFNFKNIENLEYYLKNNGRTKIFKDKEEFTIDFSNKKILKNNKEVSLKMNEGFLNSFTLNRLFNLKAGNSYYLAKSFVEAGVEIPKEVFVGLFGK